MKAIGLSRNARIEVKINDHNNILQNQREINNVPEANSSVFSIEDIPDNGSPDGALIMSEILFNYTLVPQGSTHTWVKLKEE